MSEKKTNTETKNPQWNLVQDKAYYTIEKDGSRIRKTKSVTIAVGWEETSQKGLKYISFSTVLNAPTTDVDGKVKFVLFPYEKKA